MLVEKQHEIVTAKAVLEKLVTELDVLNEQKKQSAIQKFQDKIQSAIDNGDIDAMLKLGNICEQSSEPHEAARLYRILIGLGNAKAMFSLACMLTAEISYTDFEHSVVSYWRSVVPVWRSGINSLMSYTIKTETDYIKTDPIEAQKLFKMAVKLGHVGAMQTLAGIYYMDRNVNIDPWFRKKTKSLNLYKRLHEISDEKDKKDINTDIKFLGGLIQCRKEDIFKKVNELKTKKMKNEKTLEQTEGYLKNINVSLSKCNEEYQKILAYNSTWNSLVNS